MMTGVPERAAGKVERRLLDDLKAGLRYASATEVIFMLLIISTVTSIFGRSYVQLLPAFAKDVLNEGSGGLGLMMSAPGAGTLAGAALLGAMGDVQRKGYVLLGGMVLFSATLVAFTLSRSFTLTLGLLFLTGLTSIIFSTMMTSMLQITAPAHMRGRVMALLTVTLQGFAPLGALLTGALAIFTGTPFAIAISAVVVALAALVAYLRAPTVRDYAPPDDFA
jgi:predicted MFS family arabinose efflux permease